MISRRQFIGCSAAIASLAGGRLGSVAFANTNSPTSDILVVVSLRGGCDGLNLVAPADDAAYVAARPAALRLAANGERRAIRLENGLAGAEFWLHPQASGLHELYQSGALALVHATGLKNATRSHFEAMDLMERGTDTGMDGGRPANNGWIARHLQTVGVSGQIPAIATSKSSPLALMGTQAVSIPDPASFGVSGHWRYGTQQQAALRSLYDTKSRLGGAAHHTLDALETIKVSLPRDGDQVRPYVPTDGVQYPTDNDASEISGALRSVAQLVKLNLGLSVATVDYGGWDTHEGQEQHFPKLVDGLSRALAAFYNDMSAYHDRLTVVVVSEFGRRLKSNESGGTDHGHGNALFVLGGAVRGGRMYGTWPGLADEQLEDGDLQITTDYRAVLGELLSARMGNAQTDNVFPGLGTFEPLGFITPR